MYDKKILGELLAREEYRTIDDKGNILFPSNVVYGNISLAMSQRGSHMTAKHIYTVLRQNRTGLYDHVLRTFNIDHEAFDKSKDNTLEMSGCKGANTQTFN